MLAFEADACKKAAGVIAVSETDSATMRKWFDVEAASVPTGVDVDYFEPPAQTARDAQGLVFVGSMDWMPNIDGIRWFTEAVLPLIREKRRDLPVTIVGRLPPPEIQALAETDSFLKVTGTVPDVRPYLWGACISIVPLRIGGGTRLKIYESMAAGVPVLSTTVGAEGLDVVNGETIALADTPEEFARLALELTRDSQARAKMSAAAREMVASRYSWSQVAQQFEALLTGVRGSA